jgi:hypothetical protein
MTLTGVNDDELVEFKIGESDAYRGRERWGVGALASDADALGFRETRQTGGIFEIEAVRRIRRDEFAGERRLAAPTRTQQRNNPPAAQSGADENRVSRAGQHSPESHHENPAVNAGFPW